MDKAQELLYAAVGVGDLALDKARNLKRYGDREANRKLYKDFIGRGRKVSRRVRNSAPGKQVISVNDAAKRQVQDATKTVGKALGVNVVSWPKGRSSSTGKKKTAGRKTTTRKTTAKAS